MQYHARINWDRSTADFNPRTFDRTHQVMFGTTVTVDASSAKEYLGRAELPNPEELFTASISSCFMLTFLYWASAQNLIVDRYEDNAVGVLAKGDEGKMMITEVVLNPVITFGEEQQITRQMLDGLLKKAHDQCFISSSVKTKISVKNDQSMAA